MTASRSNISPSYNGSRGCHHNPKTCGSLGGNLGVASKDCEDVTEGEGRRMETMCEPRKAGGWMVHLVQVQEGQGMQDANLGRWLGFTRATCDFPY